jgi:hypothetical protein
MSSDARAGRKGTVEMGVLAYRRHGEHGIAEVPPEQCPNGHPLKPGHVLVGWDGYGRTYTCWICYKAGVPVHTMRYKTASQVNGAPLETWQEVLAISRRET